MTDLEENCWSDSLCQNCGSQIRSEGHLLTFGELRKRFCSRFCYDQGLRLVTVSAPVFIAPPAMNLRQHLRRASTQVRK
jgi:hypothetical protein